MFNITAIPAFNDNYIWAISVPGCKDIAVVDPGDAAVVKHYLKANQLNLSAILITHHHQDHTGGVKQLAADYELTVYGPANSPFDGIQKVLGNGDAIDLFGQSLTIQEVPGHTLDHISYFHAAATPQLLCGDTLFLAGCGRLFEGSAAQMFSAMNYFKALPDNTEIYCTHEYSLANLAFAAAVEPDNDAIQDSISHCNSLRQQQTPTLPSTIGAEKKINPFMRTAEASVRQAAELFSGSKPGSETDVFATIREWKNQF
ncbi:hydroxyacylglutathione hydrolase [Amphritea sp. HPY]|uniref:hydroxyacylglutathione hydrolase n=1 Tax=Amphritea sp. HPY TaxID=3421652 RepID=UPI003D7CA672